MVKLRNAKYCNLKILLLYLVVYAHWSEPYLPASAILSMQYRLIYLFHMPTFVFLFGLFLRQESDCRRQAKRLLLLYLSLQILSCMLCRNAINLFTPYWILWFLLSCSAWAALGWVWFRFGKSRFQALILGLSICFGCLAGFLPWIGRTLSLSRTIVLFPYFWIGLLSDPGKLQKQLRHWYILALLIVILCFFCFGHSIPISFLYQASPYHHPQQVWLRLGCYLCGFSMLAVLLLLIPGSRLPFTRAGTDTLPGYLLHAPLVLILREFPIPSRWLPLLSATLLYIIYKLTQWNGPLFGIISERRHLVWPDLKKYIIPTASRSTGSF